MAIQFFTRNFLSQGFTNTQKVSITEFFRMPRRKALQNTLHPQKKCLLNIFTLIHRVVGIMLVIYWKCNDNLSYLEIFMSNGICAADHTKLYHIICIWRFNHSVEFSIRIESQQNQCVYEYVYMFQLSIKSYFQLNWSIGRY